VGSPASGNLARMDPRANFLELFCWRDFDSRRRLLTSPPSGRGQRRALKARTAATALGLTILLTVLWIYLRMLLAAPTDVVAQNFFFDTLLFCGAILLLANSIDKMKKKVGTLLIANRKIAG